MARAPKAFVNASFCAGPMTFALPAVAGLKSRLVGEEEQGRTWTSLLGCGFSRRFVWMIWNQKYMGQIMIMWICLYDFVYCVIVYTVYMGWYR